MNLPNIFAIQLLLPFNNSLTTFHQHEQTNIHTKKTCDILSGHSRFGMRRETLLLVPTLEPLGQRLCAQTVPHHTQPQLFCRQLGQEVCFSQSTVRLAAAIKYHPHPLETNLSWVLLNCLTRFPGAGVSAFRRVGMGLTAFFLRVPGTAYTCRGCHTFVRAGKAPT